uniref:Uncharacterized protein n=1 Tax=Rhizophora mucronata TaxID=61149 RepID=A0A2P2P3T9_RHIMU
MHMTLFHDTTMWEPDALRLPSWDTTPMYIFSLASWIHELLRW